VLPPLRITDPESTGITLASVLSSEPIPEYYTSTIVPDQLPEFVGLEHSTFVEFLQEYYRWMEKGTTHGATGAGAIHTSQHLTDNRDPDKNIDVFFDMMRKEFMNAFPEKFADNVNKRSVLKNIRSFYRAKGSSDSIKFLFKLLFNSVAEIYLPKEDMFRISVGTYNTDDQILLSSSHGASIYECEGLIIQQVNPTNPTQKLASANVKKATQYIGEGYNFFALELRNIVGVFDPILPIIVPTETDSVTEKLLPVIDKITIDDGGQEYAIGDTITMKASRGRGGRGYVSSVSESTISGKTGGAITTIDILDSGINFTENDTISVSIDTKNGNGALIGVSGGGSVHPSRRFYDTTTNLLSSKSKLQDNHYYQDFSYVIRSAMPLYTFKTAIKKLIHPAGYALFGDYLLSYELESANAAETSYNIFETPLIGHYTPYTLHSWENLRDNSQSVDLFPDGFSGDLDYLYYTESGTNVHVLGASGPLGDDDNPGGTLNRPQGDQIVFYEDTDSEDADYWLIYPHPNTREFLSSDYGSGITNADNITVQFFLARHPENDTSITTGDYVYQSTGIFLPEAQGVIVSISPYGPNGDKSSIKVARYSNEPFMKSGINTGNGMTSGLLYSSDDLEELAEWKLVWESPTTDTYDGMTFDFIPLTISDFHRKLTR